MGAGKSTLHGILLLSGTYVCPNDPNICDQEVKVYSRGGNPTAVKVEYTGYCGSMGPYLYPCSGRTCRDTNAEFRIESARSYTWRNLGHPYSCRLVLKAQHPSQFLPRE
jgi:hypothetical protein